MKLNNKIRLHFVAPWVHTGMGFLNKNFFYSFLGAVLASSFLFVFSCSKDESNSEDVKYTLIISKPKNGTVTSEPKGINCGSEGIACKAQVADGAKIKLIAAADAGYELGAWGGACNGQDKKTCELTINANKIANKIFNLPDEYTLAIDPKPINGTIISDIGDINCGGGNNDCDFSFDRGSKVTLTAALAGGYLLGNWDGDDCSGPGNTCKLTMNADKTVSKTFTIAQYTLTITAPTNGTIASSPPGINCESGDPTKTDCEADFVHGTNVTLTAMPKTNYEFGDWSGGGCSGSGATCAVVMTVARTVTKAFTIIQHTLTVSSPICGTVTDGDSTINCGSGGNDCSAQFDKGKSVTLTAMADTDYTIGDWGGDCSGSACTLSMDTNKTVTKAFTISPSANDEDNDCASDTNDVDDDNNGLIEVHNLDMFNNIRHNLAGTSYKTGSSVSDDRTGAPEMVTANCTVVVSGTSVYLCGYELTTDLDFATDVSYEGSSVNTDWRPNDQADASGNAATPDNALNPGFVGIDGLAGIFEGNGHSISHLYSRGGGVNVGLFRSITADASIRNVGVVDANLYGSAGNDIVGALVGQQTEGSRIIASYAKGGSVKSGGGVDNVGGLVGNNYKGSIIASYAAVDVNGGAGNDSVGGLVGWNEGSISASYTTGAVSGGAGNDNVGGLVGWDSGGTITASYAAGNVNGGGSLVGALVGYGEGTITASYGFGSVIDRAATNVHGAPGSLTVNGLTVDNADTDATKNIWDDAANNTKDAWDFGDNTQAPALKYADYDGTGSLNDVDYCALFPEKIPGTNTDLECGTTLLPGQRP